MPKEITLTRGQVAIVDDEDFEYLSQWKWYARKSINTFYASRFEKRTLMLHMHRIVLERHGINLHDTFVDHINQNGLDNRKSNLRIATKTENMRNIRAHRDSSTGFKGVTWDNRVKKWRARINVDKKEIHIGTFATPELAAAAYDKKAVEMFGEFARPNSDNDGSAGATW